MKYNNIIIAMWVGSGVIILYVSATSYTARGGEGIRLHTEEAGRCGKTLL